MSKYEEYSEKLDLANERQLISLQALDKYILQYSSLALGLLMTLVKSFDVKSSWWLYLSVGAFTINITLTILSFIFSIWAQKEFARNAEIDYNKSGESIIPAEEEKRQKTHKWNIVTKYCNYLNLFVFLIGLWTTLITFLNSIH